MTTAFVLFVCIYICWLSDKSGCPVKCLSFSFFSPIILRNFASLYRVNILSPYSLYPDQKLTPSSASRCYFSLSLSLATLMEELRRIKSALLMPTRQPLWIPLSLSPFYPHLLHRSVSNCWVIAVRRPDTRERNSQSRYAHAAGVRAVSGLIRPDCFCCR